VLLTTATAAGLIQQGQISQLARVIESGRRIGMSPLTDAIVALVRNGTVHMTEAYRKALDREALLAALKRDGVDTSVVERLA
jgi:Tfp pilus assembly ATPase PilU